MEGRESDDRIRLDVLTQYQRGVVAMTDRKSWSGIPSSMARAPKPLWVLLFVILVAAYGSVGASRPAAVANTTEDEAHDVRLVGYHDMQGRQALQVTTKSDAANGNWVYVGHVPNTRTGDATLNPITGQKEWNGTSILEISDPAHPKLVWHIPNEASANSRSVAGGFRPPP